MNALYKDTIKKMIRERMASDNEVIPHTQIASSYLLNRSNWVERPASFGGFTYTLKPNDELGLPETIVVVRKEGEFYRVMSHFLKR